MNSKNPHLTIVSIIFGLSLINLFFNSDTLKYIVFLILFISIISLKATKIIDLLWFRLAYILSLFVPKILLTIIFYFILTPLAFLSRFPLIFDKKKNIKNK